MLEKSVHELEENDEALLNATAKHFDHYLDENIDYYSDSDVDNEYYFFTVSEIINAAITLGLSYTSKTNAVEILPTPLHPSCNKFTYNMQNMDKIIHMPLRNNIRKIKTTKNNNFSRDETRNQNYV